MSFHIRPIREEVERPSALKKLLTKIIAMVRSTGALRTYLHKHNEDEQQKLRRVTILKRSMTVLLALLCAAALFTGMFKALIALRILSFSNFASIAGAVLPEDNHGFVNVLVLGEGDNDHSGVDLTDAIMVVSIDASKTKSAVMLSLPRDLYVLETKNMGPGRINSLYRNYKNELHRQGEKESEASRQSMLELQTEIGKIVGLQMHGVIKLNFSGFEEAIDALDGIGIDVPEEIVDPEYPGPNDTYETFAIGQGQQHLNGKTALKYARSRHSTSDFSRSGRQQQIIAAAMKKATELGLIKSVSRITELLTIVSRNLATTFSTRELISVATLGKSVDPARIISMQLNDKAGLYDGFLMPGGFLYAPPREEFEGASVLLPVSVPPTPITWKQLHALGSLLFQRRALYIRQPSIVVLNAGAKPGMARKLAGELIRYGLHVTDVRNYDKELTPPSPESFVAIALPPPKDAPNAQAQTNRLRFTANFLEATLRIKRLDFEAPQLFEGSPEIIVAIGKDYMFTPLQDLLGSQ